MAQKLSYFIDGALSKELYQWDLNKKLVVENADEVNVSSFQFCNEKSNCAMAISPTVIDGKYYVNIPNILLQTSGMLVVYLCYAGDIYTSTTMQYITIPIRARNKPCNYI